MSPIILGAIFKGGVVGEIDLLLAALAEKALDYIPAAGEGVWQRGRRSRLCLIGDARHPRSLSLAKGKGRSLGLATTMASNRIFA